VPPIGGHGVRAEFEREVEAARREFAQEAEAIGRELGKKIEAVRALDEMAIRPP